MRPNSGYIPVESKYPLKGLNSSVPSTQVDPSYSPRIDNMFIREGVVFKRSGYNELDTTTVLIGDVLAIEDFQKEDDTRTLVALTSKRQYKFDDGTGLWVDITATLQQFVIIGVDTTGPDWFEIIDDHTSLFAVNGQFNVVESTGNNGGSPYTITAVAFGTTPGRTRITVANVADNTVDGYIQGINYPITAADSVADTFTILGLHTAQFTSSDKFIVSGSASNDGEYDVVSSTTSGGTHTVITVAAVPATSGADGSIVNLHELTTVSTDYIDWVVGTDTLHLRFYMTNGRDRLRFWDGSTGRFFIWHPHFALFTTCRTLDIFFDMLVFGNVTTTAAEPKLVAWSDTADFDDFTGGNAGTLLIPGLQGLIQRILLLGDRMIVYSDDSIGSLLFVGGTVVISSEILLQGTRLASARGIVSFGSAHMYASHENIYFFDGTRSIRGVGDTIRELYKQEYSPSNSTDMLAFNDVAKRQIFLVVPSKAVTGTAIQFVLDYDIFNLANFKWTKIQYNDRPFSLGWFLRRTGPSWVDPPAITWEEEQVRWIDEGEQADFPVRLMGSGSKVHIMDGVSSLDNGTAVTALYETRDFVIPEIDQSDTGRWGEIEADLSGIEVKVYYSLDQGSFWTLVDTQALEGAFRQYQFPIDTVSRTLRVKFESAKKFSLRWIRAWVRPAGPR